MSEIIETLQQPIWISSPDRKDSWGRKLCSIPACDQMLACKRVCHKHYQAIRLDRLDPLTGKLKSDTKKEELKGSGYSEFFKGHDKYVWILTRGAFLDVETGHYVTLNNACASWGKKVRADLHQCKFKHYLAETWEPEPSWSSKDFYNSYRPLSTLQVTEKEELRPEVEELLANLGQKDVEWLKDWLAYKITHPWECTGAIVIHGVQRSGKGTLEALMKALFKEHCASIDSIALSQDHNDWADRKFMVIADEVGTTTMRDRDLVRKQLKKYTAPNILLINKKYVGAYNAKNYASWLIFSNDKKVVDIEEGDRRFSVLFVPTPISQSLGWEISNNASFYAQNLVNALSDREVKLFKLGYPLVNIAKTAMANFYRGDDPSTDN